MCVTHHRQEGTVLKEITRSSEDTIKLKGKDKAHSRTDHEGPKW